MRLHMAVTVVFMFLGASVVGEEPKPIELTIHPRQIESPPLKYQLLPGELEKKPGNAVPILLRLPWEQTVWMNKVFPTLHEWHERPLDAPEWKSPGVLPENLYNEMKRAAYRREAFWEYPIWETKALYMILLPDVQGLRGFLVHGLAWKIRYHITRGELDKSREGILVGLANARHVAQTPFFINQLVARAIELTMLDRTAELISQPDSPNLYWALSNLPDSMLEMERAASLEGHAFAACLPAINELDRPRDAKEWSTMAGQLVELLIQLGELPARVQKKEDGSLVSELVQRLNPSEKSQLEFIIKHARSELPEMLGVPADKVAAMSDDEVGIRWYVSKRIARDQHMAAAIVLPPREAWPHLKKVQEEYKSLQEKTGARELHFFNPVTLYISTWSLKRKIESLRIIEAVRDHLATHDGNLPKSLDEIQSVPIPLDPITDKPFTWIVEGNTATLRAPQLPPIANPGGGPDAAHALEYLIHVSK